MAEACTGDLTPRDEAVTVGEGAFKRVMVPTPTGIESTGEAPYEPVKVVPPEPPPEYLTNLNVRKMYKSGGVVTQEDTSDVEIRISMPPPGVPLAKVGASSSMTINLGNFESVKLEVNVELPSYVEQLEDAYRAAKMFVDHHLNREVMAIREFKAGKDKKKESE